MNHYCVSYHGLTDAQKKNVAICWPNDEPENYYYSLDSDGYVVMQYPNTEDADDTTQS